MSGRLPFNAADLRKKQAEQGAKPTEGVLSVSALASILDGAIRAGTPAAR